MYKQTESATAMAMVQVAFITMISTTPYGLISDSSRRRNPAVFSLRMIKLAVLLEESLNN